MLNSAKTKEIIFDFRHCNISQVPLSIDNSIVEICDNFKYLGRSITFDCKLKWSNHCTLIASKCKQRLFFLRLLNSVVVKNDILHVFYTSMIESIICHNISLWWSSMNENDNKALNRITKQAAKVTQSELASIDGLYCNNCYKESKMYYGKQLSRIARLLCIYENRDQAACPFMQNAAVQKLFCTELDTCM